MSPSTPSGSDRGPGRSAGERERSHSAKKISAGLRQKPVRVTVDLDLIDYDILRDFAHTARMTHTDVLRVLVRLLQDDRVSQQVLNSANQ